MADLSKLVIPVKNTTTGVVTNQEFNLAGSGGGGDNNNFVGTTAEWNALSQAEQDEYDTVDLTDDYNGRPIDYLPTQGSGNAVSSGGVYSIVSNLVTVDAANGVITFNTLGSGGASNE